MQGAGWPAGALLSWVGASCLPGSPHSSHPCPFVLQVFRRADKNGECGFPGPTVGGRARDIIEAQGMVGGLEAQCRMEKNLWRT